MSRNLATAALALAIGSSPSAAWGMCNNANAIPGTVQYATGVQARLANDSLYSAIAAVERKIVPTLAAGGDAGATAFAMDANFVYGAVRMPSMCESGDGPFIRELDLWSNSIAFATQGEHVGFFFSSGVTGGYLSDDLGRAIGPGMSLVGTPFFAAGGALYAPFQLAMGKEPEPSPTGIRTDFVTGVTGRALGTQLLLGVAGSQGVYTNLSLEKLRLFVSAAVDRATGGLGYASGGLNALPTPVGFLSAYAKQQKLLPPLPTTSTGVPIQEAGREQNPVDLTTIHVAEQDLFHFVDVFGAYQLRPSAQFREARVAFHSPELMEALRGGPPKSGGEAYSGIFPVYYLSAGVVETPDLWYWGVPGGRRMSLRADLGVGSRGDTVAWMGLRVRRNDPDILDVMPYAAGSWSVGFALEVTRWGKR